MRHIVIMTMTSALGLTFTFFIDFLSLFWLSKLADSAITASIAIAGAIMFLTISFSIAFMIPAVALVSRAVGRGETETARQHATASLILSSSALFAIAALVLIFLNPLINYVGADESQAVLDYARRFLYIVLPSIPFFTIAMTASAVLRAHGFAMHSMYVTLLGGAIAMILDPLLIIYFDWSVIGAAIAIVIARLGMTLYGLSLLIIKHNLLAPIGDIKLNGFVAPFFAIAIPAILTQASSPVGNIILTRQIAKFGEEALAGFAVNFRLMLLAFGGVFALSGAIGGIIGQNYGAGKLDRVRETYLKAIGFGAIYSLATWILLIILRPFVADIFSLSEQASRIPDAFIWTAWHFVFVSAIFVSNAAFNTLGRPIYSTGINWFRDVLLTYPIVLFMAGMMGDVGVVYAQVVVGILTGILAAYIGWNYIAKIARGEVTVERKHS